MKKRSLPSCYWFIIVATLGFVTVGLFLLRSNVSRYDRPIENLADDEKSTPCVFRSHLDGRCVDSLAEVNPQLVAVMIENHVDARPQSGLAAASVVYEAPVEGHYTRFLALYPSDEKINKVGPVRSARPYYLDWLSEWSKPLYMHVGGSPAALAQIKSRGIRDANEFYFGAYYWRANNRFAPHNVYTNSDKWNTLLRKSDYAVVGEYPRWKFVTTTLQACTEKCIQKIRLPFLPPAYNPVWKYDATKDQYVRWQSGQETRDETGSIVADTIIIQEVTEKVLDDVGRVALSTLWSGRVTVVYSGQKFIGHWKKDSVSDRTRFYDELGKEILLKPGKIWLEIVPNFITVEFSEL